MEWIKNRINQFGILGCIVALVILLGGGYIGILYLDYLYSKAVQQKVYGDREAEIVRVWGEDGLTSYHYAENFNHIIRENGVAYRENKIGLFDLKTRRTPYSDYVDKWDVRVDKQGAFVYYIYSMENTESFMVGTILTDSFGKVLYQGVSNINDHSPLTTVSLSSGDEVNIHTYYLIDKDVVSQFESKTGMKVNLDADAFDKNFDIEYMQLSGIKEAK